jgi:hypothetical protein
VARSWQIPPARGVRQELEMKSGWRQYPERKGRELGRAGSPHNQHGVALSPDGQTAALYRGRIYDPTDNPGVWLLNLIRGAESRVAESDGTAVWTPAKNRIVYSNRNDLYTRDASGGGQEIALVSNANLKYPSDWSHDGRFLLYTEFDPRTQADIWYLDQGTAGGSALKPVKFPGTDAMET